jgi:two-component system chemotaxis response regulator CheB
MGTAIVRVVLLDASPQRRQRLQRLLEGAHTLRVVGGAAHAAQAMEAAQRERADVIVLVQAGVAADSVAAVRSIMQTRAMPVVVVCAATTPPGTALAFALMEAGALAVLRDPGAVTGASHQEALAALQRSVRLMAEVKVVRRWAPAAGARVVAPTAAVPAAPVAAAPARRRAAARRVELVAIAASTGGPVALKQLLCALPAGFPVPIVIVQHMAGGFLHGMAQWLSAACQLPMEIAGPATELRPGHAYLAPDGMHMRVAPQLRLEFAGGAPVHGHRPSASCLLGSVAAHYGPHAIGILLTGMGKDGAAELKLMHDAGAITIAQDQASSVVHGMPGEAIRCGGARYVMSPGEIGAALPALVER